jgi:hypothetical protein
VRRSMRSHGPALDREGASGRASLQWAGANFRSRFPGLSGGSSRPLTMPPLSIIVYKCQVITGNRENFIQAYDPCADRARGAFGSAKGVIGHRPGDGSWADRRAAVRLICLVKAPASAAYAAACSSALSRWRRKPGAKSASGISARSRTRSVTISRRLSVEW